MRILHIGGLEPTLLLSRKLREHHITSDSCFLYDNIYCSKPDVCLHLQQVPANQRETIAQQYLNHVIENYDIFHFHFGITFLLDKSDLKQIMDAGKKVIVHHHGSEVRFPKMAREKNPYVKTKPYWTDQIITTSLQQLSRYISHAIYSYRELYTYIEPFYKHLYYVPYGLNVSEISPHYPEPDPPIPLIVHAPTHREIKGTNVILRAIQKLKQEGYRFRFQLIEQLPHQSLQAVLQSADIVIDQLRIGDYGILSMESMALGKPVICYVREDLAIQYPNLPIINANPDTIYEKLKFLLNHPHLLHSIGKKSRTYIEKQHDINQCVNQLLSIYEQL